MDLQQLLQDAAAAVGSMQVQQQQQQQQQTAGDVVGFGSNQTWHDANGQNPAAAAAAAASGRGGNGGGQVSAAALLQYVNSRVWHSSNEQMNVARRVLAERLVNEANPGAAADQPANADPQAYSVDYPKAGVSMCLHRMFIWCSLVAALAAGGVPSNPGRQCHLCCEQTCLRLTVPPSSVGWGCWLWLQGQ
jgi:transcription initiation factor TFIID subunit TAF12